MVVEVLTYTLCTKCQLWQEARNGIVTNDEVRENFKKQLMRPVVDMPSFPPPCDKDFMPPPNPILSIPPLVLPQPPSLSRQYGFVGNVDEIDNRKSVKRARQTSNKLKKKKYV